MIELRSVSKTYRGVRALDRVDLRFEPGRTTAITGPRGSGKTILLRVMAGLIEPDQGEVLIDGQTLRPANLAECRRALGYVVADGLFPHLTAEQNVWIMLRRRGDEIKDCVKRVGELGRLLRLSEEALVKYPAELSPVERIRVGLMRGLALDPPNLILDDPLSALDAMERFAFSRELKELISPESLGGRAVVFATPNLGEAAQLSETIVLLQGGRVIQQGSVQDFQLVPVSPFVSDFVEAQRGLAAR